VEREARVERLDFWSAVSPEQALAAMLADDNVRRVEHVLLKLTPDPVYTPMILEAIRSGRLDLRLAVAWLASLLEVDLYLEVGARRGFSTAVVGAARSDASIYVFDMWVRNYVGVPNPGPRFVRSELERVGFKGDAHFINGNSHTTLPRFFGDSRYPAIDRILRRDTSAPNRDFDMVLIDGDHSIEGALFRRPASG